MGVNADDETSAGSDREESAEAPLYRFRAVHGVIIALALLCITAYFLRDYWFYMKIDPIGRMRRDADLELIERDGKTYLYGGPRESDHFDISTFRLDPRRLEYGMGREVFPAVREPVFEDVDLPDDERVIVVAAGEDVRVYPINRMTRYEVVNDVVGGTPIMVGYCILADLGCVYERRIGETTYTFGVSGYTYYERGVWDYHSAFVLWDRETESLWWPPLGKAVSGPSVDVPMKVFDRDRWAQSTWGEVRQRYPHARVLAAGLEEPVPESWPRAAPPEVPRVRGKYGPDSAIAPRWGQNSELP